MNPRPLPAIRDQHASVELGRVPSPHTPALSEEQAGPDWRRVASALLRFKWVVVLMVMLGLGGAFAATRVLRPIYRAQANVWVDVPDQRGNGGSDTRGPIRQGPLVDADAWVELLRSYIVLDQVVRDMHLYVEVKRPSDRPSFDGLGRRRRPRAGNARRFDREPGWVPLGPTAGELAPRSYHRVRPRTAARRRPAARRTVGRPDGLERQLPGVGTAGPEPGSDFQHSERRGPALRGSGGPTEAPTAHRADKDPRRPADDRSAESRLCGNRAATIPHAHHYPAVGSTGESESRCGDPRPGSREFLRHGGRARRVTPGPRRDRSLIGRW